MVIGGKSGGMYLDTKPLNNKGTMNARLKEAIDRNAERNLHFLPPDDSVNLAFQTQGIHGISDQTADILEENDSLRDEVNVLQTGNDAMKDHKGLQDQKIALLEGKIVKLEAQIGT